MRGILWLSNRAVAMMLAACGEVHAASITEEEEDEEEEDNLLARASADYLEARIEAAVAGAFFAASLARLRHRGLRNQTASLLIE